MLFRRLPLVITLFYAAATAGHAAEPQTLQFRIDCWRTEPCLGPHTDYDEVTLPYTFTCEFDDPLMPGSIVESFDVNPYYQARNGGMGGHYRTWMNGEHSGDGQYGDLGTIYLSCTPPEGFPIFFGNGSNLLFPPPVHEDGFPGYRPGQKNVLQAYFWPWPNAVMAFNRLRLVHFNVKVSYREGGTIRFDLDDAAHTDARKVLIARHRSDHSYPSPAQKADGRIEIRANAGAPGRRVYFRVIDPPDTAPYVPAADRVPNDNVGGPGRLTLTEAVSDASGYVTTELVITNRYAGDNYRVEASVDANFPCAPNCPRTGVLTAWKRVYFENDVMYRRGSFVARPTTVRDRVFVTDIRPFLGHSGHTFEIIHADEPKSSGARRRYRERHIIGDIVRVGAISGEIVLRRGEALAHQYSPGASDPALGDAVGLITGDPATDYYRVGDQVLRTLFADAFVEYVPLAPVVPVVPKVTEVDGRAYMERWLRFAEKWSESDPAPNHQHIIAATKLQNAVDPIRAEATNVQERSYVYIYTEAIGPNKNTLLAEVLAHEAAHLWHTNPKPDPDDGEHCDERQWNSPHVCQARYSYDCTSPLGGVETCAGFLDGEGAFHYKKTPEGVDSEYRWIRERCDPVPNARVALHGRTWMSYSPLPCR